MEEIKGKLTDEICLKAMPKVKPYKLFDGKGFYLHVMPTGAKYWRMKYRMSGIENNASIGVYPAISLDEARSQAYKMYDLVKSGRDVNQMKFDEKEMNHARTINGKSLHQCFRDIRSLFLLLPIDAQNKIIKEMDKFALKVRVKYAA